MLTNKHVLEPFPHLWPGGSGSGPPLCVRLPHSSSWAEDARVTWVSPSHWDVALLQVALPTPGAVDFAAATYVADRGTPRTQATCASGCTHARLAEHVHSVRTAGAPNDCSRATGSDSVGQLVVAIGPGLWPPATGGSACRRFSCTTKPSAAHRARARARPDRGGRGATTGLEASWSVGLVSKTVQHAGQAILLETSALVHQGASGCGSHQNHPHPRTPPTHTATIIAKADWAGDAQHSRPAGWPFPPAHRPGDFWWHSRPVGPWA